MVAAGADINKKNSAGETPLHQAATRGRELSVKLLLTAKADPNVSNKYSYIKREYIYFVFYSHFIFLF